MQEVNLEKGTLKFNKNLCKGSLVLCAVGAVAIAVGLNEPTSIALVELAPIAGASYITKQLISINNEEKEPKKHK